MPSRGSHGAAKRYTVLIKKGDRIVKEYESIAKAAEFLGVAARSLEYIKSKSSVHKVHCKGYDVYFIEKNFKTETVAKCAENVLSLSSNALNERLLREGYVTHGLGRLYAYI